MFVVAGSVLRCAPGGLTLKDPAPGDMQQCLVFINFFPFSIFIENCYFHRYYGLSGWMATKSSLWWHTLACGRGSSSNCHSEYSLVNFYEFGIQSRHVCRLLDLPLCVLWFPYGHHISDIYPFHMLASSEIEAMPPLNLTTALNFAFEKNPGAVQMKELEPRQSLSNFNLARLPVFVVGHPFKEAPCSSSVNRFDFKHIF